jgi:CrcB protein
MHDPDHMPGISDSAVRGGSSRKRVAVEYVWIAIGAVAGANARYIIGRGIGDRFGASFPYGTFIINVTGALVIGFLITLLTEVLVSDPRWRLLLVVGFLGSYTTFSTFTYEAYSLIDRGDWTRLGIYMVGSNVLGVTACIAGVVAARAIDTL